MAIKYFEFFFLLNMLSLNIDELMLLLPGNL